MPSTHTDTLIEKKILKKWKLPLNFSVFSNHNSALCNPPHVRTLNTTWKWWIKTREPHDARFLSDLCEGKTISWNYCDFWSDENKISDKDKRNEWNWCDLPISMWGHSSSVEFDAFQWKLLCERRFSVE